MTEFIDIVVSVLLQDILEGCNMTGITITKDIEKFDYKKVKKCYYGKCHDALNGEWINWWLVKTKNSHERRIINPAIQAVYNGKKCIADILFCERDDRSKSYKVLGVAEVENNHHKYLDKLKSLNAYIFAKGAKKKMEKFPDLKFVLLSTRLKTDKDGYATDLHFELYEDIKEKIIKYSLKSEVYWIYYQMKLKPHPDDSPDEMFDVDYLKNYDKFWYSHSFEDKPDYLIVRNGKIIKEMSQ